MMKGILSIWSIASLPRGLKIMAYGEMWDRLTFYGIITVLTLYLTQTFGFSDQHLYAFWGLATAFGFGLPVVGGILADRLLGFRLAINIGCVLIILGCLVLTSASRPALYLGLSFIVLGIGFYKGNVTSLIGLLYHDNEATRDEGFLVFYVWMVSGAILGPFLYGALSELLGFKAGFILSAMGFASFLYWFNRRYCHFEFKQQPKQLKRPALFSLKQAHQALFVLLSLALILIITYTFAKADVCNNIVLVFSVLAFIGLLFYVGAKNPGYRKPIAVIAIISLLNAIYFAAGLQVDGALVLYVSRNTHYVFFHHALPPAFFSSLEPFFSVLLASSFMFCWQKLKIKNPNLNMMLLIIFGLFLTGLGFEIFAWGAYLNDSAVWAIFMALVLGNIMIALSGVCVLPTLMSSVTRLAPKEYLGTLVGMKFMINAAAGGIGTYLADLSSDTHLKASGHLAYGHAFHEIAVFVFILTILSLIFIPITQRLLKGV